MKAHKESYGQVWLPFRLLFTHGCIGSFELPLPNDLLRTNGGSARLPNLFKGKNKRKRLLKSRVVFSFILLWLWTNASHPPQFNIDLDEWYQHRNENVNVSCFLLVLCDVWLNIAAAAVDLYQPNKWDTIT